MSGFGGRSCETSGREEEKTLVMQTNTIGPFYRELRGIKPSEWSAAPRPPGSPVEALQRPNAASVLIRLETGTHVDFMLDHKKAERVAVNIAA